jgi:transposase-like protein
MAKISDDIRAKIYRLHTEEGLGVMDLSRRFGVSKKAIRDAINKQSKEKPC